MKTNEIWYCCYWFPSNQHDGEDRSEYYVSVHQRDNKLVLESLPNETGAHMFVTLHLKDGLATGNWEEMTALGGEFEGTIYSGAVQLLVSKDGSRMDGAWVGVGRDHHENRPRIYTGRWELSHAGSRAPSEAEQRAAVL